MPSPDAWSAGVRPKTMPVRERDDHGEGEAPPIDAHLAQQGDADHVELDETSPGDREREAEDGAGRRQHEALGELCASRRLRPAPSAMRMAISRCRGPCAEQEVRQVRADDQHDHPHGAGEDEDRETDVAADLSCDNGLTTPSNSLRSGRSRLMICASARTSACARSAETPGLRRPISAIV